MGNNKRATCFATLLQNESAISDGARFTTHVRTCKVASSFRE